MALEGSLKEFNLADILQLIFFQKKTGVLALQGRDDKVRILFHEGNIVGAESRKRDAENRLGNVLVKRGIIKESDINSAIERQKSEGGKFGSILVRHGYATKEQIQEVIQFQITETMVQLFAWKEGKYEFTPQGVPLDKEIGLSLDTQHFLMEGLRMVDEWSEIGDRITIGTIFIRTEVEATDLTDEENEVLALVDGVSDVGAISDVLGKDSFSVSTTLLGLLEKGVVDRKPTAEEAGKVKIEKPKVKKPIPGLGVFLALLFCALFAAATTFSVIKTKESMKPFRASEKIDVLRHQIDAYYINNKSYPTSIEGQDPWGNPFVYKADENGYVIFSAGPDGNPGTKDDIF